MKLNSKLVEIRVDQPPKQDDSGIYTLEEWQTLPPTGVVLAVSDDVTFCKKGDKVFFERYSAIPTPVEGVRMCREDAVFKVL